MIHIKASLLNTDFLDMGLRMNAARIQSFPTGQLLQLGMGTLGHTADCPWFPVLHVPVLLSAAQPLNSTDAHSSARFWDVELGGWLLLSVSSLKLQVFLFKVRLPDLGTQTRCLFALNTSRYPGQLWRTQLQCIKACLFIVEILYGCSKWE